MTNIDRNGLRSILAYAGTTIVTLVAHTDPRMVKKDRASGEPNPYLGAIKIATVNGIIGWRYANAVNNQRQREANPQTIETAEAVPVFDALARTWGEKAKEVEIDGITIALESNPFINHKNVLYLEIKCERAIEVSYVLVGQKIDVEILRPYLPLHKSESKRQQVEREIVLRDYRLDNIRELRIHGSHYLVA